MTTAQSSVADAFVDAIIARDFPGAGALLHPEIDFRAMTPSRIWEATGPDDVVAAFTHWFGDDDHVEGVESVETDAFADRQRVGYRLRVRRADGVHLVEQQAYLSERDGRIGWLRVLCSGYRPLP